MITTAKCTEILSKILDFVATIMALNVSMFGQKYLVLLPQTAEKVLTSHQKMS